MEGLNGNSRLLRIFIGESDKWQGRPLDEAIVREAKQRGLAGASVFRGYMGYGAGSRIHTAKVLRLSEDLPIMIEIVDQTEKVEAFLPALQKMVRGGMMTLEHIQVLHYQS